MKYRQHKTYKHEIAQDTTTFSFIKGKSLGGRQILKTCELLVCSRRKHGQVGVQKGYFPLVSDTPQLQFFLFFLTSFSV